MNVLSKPGAAQQGSPEEVPIIPWRPSLLDLPTETIEHILEFLGVEAMKVIRLINKYFLAVSRNCKTRHFKHWRLGSISTKRFRLFINKVEIIKGIQLDSLRGSSSYADKSMEILARKRPELESVAIHFSQCTDNTLQLLVQHPKVKNIRLRGSNFTGELPSATSSSGVEVLDLSSCERLSDDGMLCLLNKTGGTLRVLNIRRTNVSFSNIESMTSSLSQLEKVNLQHCSELTETGLVTFLNKVGSTLKSFELSGRRSDTFWRFQRWNWTTLSTRFPVLEELGLKDSHELKDASILTFLNNTGESLRILNLRDTSLSDIGPFTTQFRLLENLNLSYCECLIDSGMVAILNRTGENLKVLDLASTSVFFNDIGSLTTTFPVLEMLDLSYCPRLSYDGIVAFLQKTSGNLETRLRCSNLEFFSNYLSDAFPHLKINNEKQF